MCGIAGIFDLVDEHDLSRRKIVLDAMLAPLLARGPDGRGIWHDPCASLGHTRLSIIDLSDASNQPLKLENDDCVIVYNGEVYNYEALRKELIAQGERFFSAGDTEVVLRGFRKNGVEWLNKLNGMFAAAIYDRRNRELTLFRDRFGIKPLYWSVQNGKVIFASLIASILKDPDFRARFNLRWLNEYLSFQYVHGNETPFENLHMVAAGSALIFKQGKTEPEAIVWAPPRHYSPDYKVSFAEASDTVSELFRKAVSRSMVSDVPVGSYLSGGIDSGAIVALARAQQKHLSTFTCGINDAQLSADRRSMDETEKARKVASIVGCDFHHTQLSPSDITKMHGRVLQTIEEPRLGVLYQNDCAAQLARSHVRVCLSGAGGDELFGGYPWRYRNVRNANNRNAFVDGYYGFWQRVFSDGEKAAYLQPAVRAQIDLKQPSFAFGDQFPQDADYRDAGTRTWLCLKYETEFFLHSLLQIGDRIAGAYGFEERFPFLDLELLSYVDQIPAEYHWDGEEEPADGKYVSGKRLLRAALSKLVSPEIAAHPKQGFSIPIREWFDGPVSDLVTEELCSKDARILQYLKSDAVEHAIASNKDGSSLSAAQLWSLLSLESLLKTFF